VLIVTNAAGGLNPNFRPGDIMLISDHVNLTGANPLIGPNADQWGLRFPDMTRAYNPRLAEMYRQAAAANRIKLQAGVYGGLTGPSLETPAEVRMLKTIGVDAVGFSTVHEVIAAVHAGMQVLALSTITNVNDPDRPVPATLEEIITVAQTAAPTIDRSIADLVEKMDAPETS
jgi:purine-nucleoside phosphorylase